MIEPSSPSLPLLRLRSVVKHFQVRSTFGSAHAVRALDGVDLDVRANETVALVGESGSGKTTLARIALALERPTSGTVEFCGSAVDRLGGEERRAYRRSVQAVFQDPQTAFNPRQRVRGIVGEPLRSLEGLSGSALQVRVVEALGQVGLPAHVLDRFPSQLSGGQRQRVAIARAVSTTPDLIVLDEPVSALDVSVRAQVMNVLKDLRADEELAFLLIAHDLGTVRYMADRVVVLYRGRVVEQGPVDAVCGAPVHPYTRALLSSALPADPRARTIRAPILDVRDTAVPSPGCRFRPRCPNALESCHEIDPQLTVVSDSHAAACVLVGSAHGSGALP